MKRPARFATLALLSALTAAPAPGLPGAAAAGTDPEVGALLRDYIGLYGRDTLDAWRGLFHPAFVAAYTNDDGTTTSRNLDEFVARQKNYFATGRTIREDLADVQVDRQGRLASVRAAFTLHDGPTEKKGRLMMLLIHDKDRFVIQSLVFTYHLD
jgi:SnoaL-like protein